jgi:hypothetical protein
MILLLGLGLAQLFEAVPSFKTALTALSVAYMLWLAWKFGTAAPKALDAPETGGHPLTFLQAAAFQWVNPKGWAMALTALAAYTADDTVGAVLGRGPSLRCDEPPLYLALGRPGPGNAPRPDSPTRAPGLQRHHGSAPRLDALADFSGAMRGSQCSCRPTQRIMQTQGRRQNGKSPSVPARTT